MGILVSRLRKHYKRPSSIKTSKESWKPVPQTLEPAEVPPNQKGKLKGSPYVNSPVPLKQAVERGTESMRANYQLPFDILTQIFELVRDTETEDQPLERVLAVCHFWRDVALEHRSLWTTFNVHIQSRDDVKLWTKRFRYRSYRYGATAPLDITLELTNRKEKGPLSPSGIYDTNFRPSWTDTQAYVLLRILKVFSGPHGSGATRWRHLTLDLLRLANDYNDRGHFIDHFLQHRTPNLETLRLYGVNTTFALHKQIFPYAPRLRRATFHSCHLSNYPDTSDLTSLTWYGAQENLQLQSSRIVQSLTTARNITSLEIGFDWLDWSTPLIFRSVETLRIPRVIHVGLIGMLRVPSLRRLGLGLDEAGHFALVAECKGIPCEQVETLEISYAVGGEQKVEQSHSVVIREKMMILIETMVSLRTIVWKDDMIKPQPLLKDILEPFVNGNAADEPFEMPAAYEDVMER